MTLLESLYLIPAALVTLGLAVFYVVGISVSAVGYARRRLAVHRRH